MQDAGAAAAAAFAQTDAVDGSTAVADGIAAVLEGMDIHGAAAVAEADGAPLTATLATATAQQKLLEANSFDGVNNSRAGGGDARDAGEWLFQMTETRIARNDFELSQHVQRTTASCGRLLINLGTVQMVRNKTPLGFFPADALSLPLAAMSLALLPLLLLPNR